ncbi:hypothetical protein KHC23_13010 [Ancylobacter dichloromethanicus]|uniref:Uncharacterized protein n=1 Tax=Ancylobacter dichloromethanicus TaxID=518825 RepID=A0A9W6J8K2_9HYPH|nr:hypothetical protein [Ancylobacter dichloromethanicus]MBS7554573.1 hypothetical protein [Ancylobacter dichloromethanicus]GLK71703.1 hypothetical protein GCM10017643_18180 [Ancylobacter dichloromethanicus]
MAFTQADVDKLKKAMATGVKSLTYSDGKKAEYHSLSEMTAWLRQMEAEVAKASGVRAPRSVLLEQSRDW